MHIGIHTCALIFCFAFCGIKANDISPKCAQLPIEKDYKKNYSYCNLMVFNQTVECYFCYEGVSQNFHICETSILNITTATILENIPESTLKLMIIYDNIWYGYLPRQPGPIDLKNLGRLINLTEFYMVGKYNDFYQMHSLDFDPDSLGNMTELKKFALQLPVLNAHDLLPLALSQFKKLELVDLSYARGLGAKTVVDIMLNISQNAIKYMCFRKIQLPGSDTFIGDLYSEFKHITPDMLRFPNLRELDLSDNMFTRMPSDITEMAPFLKRLDISRNALIDSRNMFFFYEIVLHPHIEVIDAAYQGFASQSSPHYVQQHKKEDPISESKVNMVLSQRQLAFFVQCFNAAKTGNISISINDSTHSCKIIKCMESPQLEDCRCSKQKMIPAFNTILNLSCFTWVEIPMGKNLHTFNFSFIHWENANVVGVAYNGNLCFKKGNKLHTLIMDSNSAWITSANTNKGLKNMKNIIGLDSLSYLSMSNNSFSLFTETMKAASFGHTFASIKYVDVSGNSINYNNKSEVCKILPNLISMNLANGNITYLPKMLFHNCSELKYLYLGGNRIKTDSLGFLDLNYTNNLLLLDFSYSTVSELPKEFLSMLEKYEKLRINLQGCKLTCDCSPASEYFTKWLQSHSLKMMHYDTYSCSGKSGQTFVKNIDPKTFWNNCSESNDVRLIIMSVISTISIILGISILVIVYRKRWRIQYMVFCLYQNVINRCKKPDDEDSSLIIWKYDAFVSYCAEDRFWVHETLMKGLENDYGFRLCIHYRDFEPGADIANMIAKSMQESREIIIVLSDVALRSEWCNFELDQALIQLAQRKQNMIVIKLGNITGQIFNPKVANILENHTTMTWSEKPEAQELFWKILVGRLYKDFKGNCLCPYGPEALGYQHIVDTVLDACEEDDTVEESILQHENAYTSPAVTANINRAKEARLLQNLANAYMKTLEGTLQRDEDLPYWMFGPTPHPVSQILHNYRDELDQQSEEYARQKVKLIIKCLKNFVEKQNEIHAMEMRKVQAGMSLNDAAEQMV